MVLIAYDTDESGDLNEMERDELQADMVLGCEARHARLIEEFDLDGNGELSDEEASAAQEELEIRREAHLTSREAHRTSREAMVLETYDEDGDGVLNREERNSAHEARHNHRQTGLYSEFDGDGDGLLSEEEHSHLSAEIQRRIQEGESLRRHRNEEGDESIE